MPLPPPPDHLKISPDMYWHRRRKNGKILRDNSSTVERRERERISMCRILISSWQNSSISRTSRCEMCCVLEVVLLQKNEQEQNETTTTTAAGRRTKLPSSEGSAEERQREREREKIERYKNGFSPSS